MSSKGVDTQFHFYGPLILVTRNKNRYFICNSILYLYEINHASIR
jgi:hypothetical protein